MIVTPENITELKPNAIFVFGSNLSGIHGKGAAKTARRWGACDGVGIGRSGQTYAIPTRGRWRASQGGFNSLGLEEIGEHVHDFLQYAKRHPELEFLVTKIGCGYAGFSPQEMSIVFAGEEIPENVALPKEFWALI